MISGIFCSYLKQSGDPLSLLLDLQGSDYFILRPKIGAVQYLRYLIPGRLENIGETQNLSQLVFSALCFTFIVWLILSHLSEVLSSPGGGGL